MALTLSQATTAGEIAAQLTELQTALAAAQSALSGGMFIVSHGLNLRDAKNKNKVSINSGQQLGSAASVAVLNQLITAYQNSIISLNSQLAGM